MHVRNCGDREPEQPDQPDQPGGRNEGIEKKARNSI